MNLGEVGPGCARCGASPHAGACRPFAVGEPVKMVGCDSVRMTVSGYALQFGDGPELVSCCWFDVHAQLQRASFPEALLVKWAPVGTSSWINPVPEFPRS
jgi:uncharacterized protein YodC (DUF2158 family)